MTQKEWVSFFAKKAGVRGAELAILHIAFSRLVGRPRLMAVLLASSIMYTREIAAEDSEDKEAAANPHRWGLEAVLETLGFELNHLLEERLILTFHYQSPPEEEKPFGTYGGADL